MYKHKEGEAGRIKTIKHQIDQRIKRGEMVVETGSRRERERESDGERAQTERREGEREGRHRERRVSGV